MLLLETIKALIGVGDQAKQLRPAVKNERIIAKFPWLWAIRSEWNLTRVDLKVSKNDSPPFLSEEILHSSREGDDVICGVYLHCMSMDTANLTDLYICIWNGITSLEDVAEYPSEKWCQAIHRRIYSLNRILVLQIALAYQKGNAIMIYRPYSVLNLNNAIRSIPLS